MKRQWIEIRGSWEEIQEKLKYPDLINVSFSVCEELGFIVVNHTVIPIQSIPKLDIKEWVPFTMSPGIENH